MYLFFGQTDSGATVSPPSLAHQQRQTGREWTRARANEQARKHAQGRERSEDRILLALSLELSNMLHSRPLHGKSRLQLAMESNNRFAHADAYARVKGKACATGAMIRLGGGVGACGRVGECAWPQRSLPHLRNHVELVFSYIICMLVFALFSYIVCILVIVPEESR
jgi:hypothetical protein